jgi:hypothetical protein
MDKFPKCLTFSEGNYIPEGEVIHSSSSADESPFFLVSKQGKKREKL